MYNMAQTNSTQPREVNVTIERIDYQAGSVTGKGALIWNDKVSGTRPLLLMMTNWLSVTENATKRAQQMASDVCTARARPAKARQPRKSG
jgi:hypothetical protein